jgi:hypothetical protein
MPSEGMNGSNEATDYLQLPAPEKDKFTVIVDSFIASTCVQRFGENVCIVFRISRKTREQINLIKIWIKDIHVLPFG